MSSPVVCIAQVEHSIKTEREVRINRRSKTTANTQTEAIHLVGDRNLIVGSLLYLYLSQSIFQAIGFLLCWLFYSNHFHYFFYYRLLYESWCSDADWQQSTWIYPRQNLLEQYTIREALCTDLAYSMLFIIHPSRFALTSEIAQAILVDHDGITYGNLLASSIYYLILFLLSIHRWCVCYGK